MFTLLGLWLFILYAATPVLAHSITNVTVTTTSTLIISVFDFAPTTHLTRASTTPSIAYPNASIPALAATPIATIHIYLSTKSHASESTSPNILTGTITAVATSASTYEKEDKGDDDHESHPHTTPPSQSKVAKPAWINPSTAVLLCFDFLAATFFVWCWVMGWFSWLKGDQSRDRRMGQGGWQAYRAREARDSDTRAPVNQNVEREMRRLGMV